MLHYVRCYVSVYFLLMQRGIMKMDKNELNRKRQRQFYKRRIMEGKRRVAVFLDKETVEFIDSFPGLNREKSLEHIISYFKDINSIGEMKCN